MFAKDHLWILVVLGLLCISPNSIYGQVGTGIRIGEKGEKGESDFRVATGMAISFTGPEYFYEFSLADENGFAYDVWSLVSNPQVVEHAGLTTNQVGKMGLIREATKKELLAGISKGFSSDESKAEFEQIFRQAENEMRDVMDADQLSRFEHVKNQLNIEKVGIAKFLAARAMRETLGLNEAEAESLTTAAAEIETKSKELLEDVFRDANLELVRQLPEKQTASFDELFGKDDKDNFLSQQLFAGNSPKTKVRKLSAPDFLRLLVRSKKTREKIELTEAQLHDIKALRVKRDSKPEKGSQQKIESEIRQILDEGQYEKLMSLTIQKEAARWGTVNSLCGGSLGRFLELSDEDSKRLFQLGLEISNDLQTRIQQSKRDLWKDSLHALSPASQEKIMKFIGKPIVFESE